jgi:hypothetical protein
MDAAGSAISTAARELISERTIFSSGIFVDSGLGNELGDNAALPQF